jgi:hypothetical protein
MRSGPDLLLATVLWATLASCHPIGVSSCEIASDSGQWTCFEWEGEPHANTRNQCAGFGKKGRWAESPCPREKAVGGCRIYVGTRIFTEWRAGGGATEERLREDCMLKGAGRELSGVRVEYLVGGRPSPDAGRD